jgi:aspartate carbamoyltransferase catalytic subunit
MSSTGPEYALSSPAHCRSIEELGVERVRHLLELTDHMVEVNRRPNPKVPALRSRTVCNIFFEDSTRTRLSFEMAARRLSADTMTFAVNQSSLNKGESLRDTIETLSAMGVDAFVVRHRSSGVPWAISRWTNAAVVNAGDGWHAHPTQALLDCYTLMSELSGTGPRRTDLNGVKIAIVGDLKHSRVARSSIAAFEMLGAEVTAVAPRTLIPPHFSTPVTQDLDGLLPHIDALYLLRMQSERMSGALVPDLSEYTMRFGLTPERARLMGDEVVVMHPGPMNRGVEITVDPSELTRSVITQQVTTGIAVRMAVLFDVLGSGVSQTAPETHSETHSGSHSTPLPPHNLEDL